MAEMLARVPVYTVREHVRMTLQGGERETSGSEVDYSGIHPWRHHDVGRLQEESRTTAATATAARRRLPRRFRPIRTRSTKGMSTTLTWQTTQRHRCQHRRHRRRSAERLAAGDAGRIDHLSPGRERRGRNAGGNGAGDGERSTAATSSDRVLGNRRGVVLAEREGRLLRLRRGRTFVPTSRRHAGRTRSSCSSIRTFSSRLRATATSAVPPNTTCALGDRRANAVKNALDPGGRERQPHQDHQLRQGEAVLHRVQRNLLAAEPPRALRVQQVTRHRAREAEPDHGISSRASFHCCRKNDRETFELLSLSACILTMRLADSGHASGLAMGYW